MTPVAPDYGMPVHPACDLFPLMDEESSSGLAADIQTHGLLNPIVIHEGHIVDGRNRIVACRKAGVEPRFVEWREIYTGEMAVARWISSVNVKRRHLTDEQIAAVEVAINAWEAQEAAQQRKLDALKLGPEARKKRGEMVPETPQDAEMVSANPPAPVRRNRSGDTRVVLAKNAGVSENRIRQALTVQKANPELLIRVAQGDLTLREAVKQVNAAATSPAPEPAASLALAETPATTPPAPRAVRAQRIDRLARLRLSFLESTKHFAHLIAWLGETSGDFEQAEALLSNATESIAALAAKIERLAVAADPLNASRLGIKEASSCQ